MVTEDDLVGTWRLVACFYVDEDGSASEGPMGDRADGLLIYHGDGHMAASLMRQEPLSRNDGADVPTYLGTADDYLGYTGRWYVRDDTVVHEVVIGSPRRVVDTEQARRVEMTGGGLRLSRNLDGPHACVVMDWRRA